MRNLTGVRGKLQSCSRQNKNHILYLFNSRGHLVNQDNFPGGKWRCGKNSYRETRFYNREMGEQHI